MGWRRGGGSPDPGERRTLATDGEVDGLPGGGRARAGKEGEEVGGEVRSEEHTS